MPCRMSRRLAFSFLLLGARATRRDLLLAHARERLVHWYGNQTIMETPRMQDGVSITMLRADLNCEGALMPVTFSEFDVPGASPEDVFAAVLDTVSQPDWNDKCAEAHQLGEWPSEGVRGFAVAFEYPMVGQRALVQWQAAHADLDKNEFWVSLSSRDSADLDSIKEQRGILEGTAMADNCVGAFRITAGPNGDAHVLTSSHMNLHVWMPFSPHSVLSSTSSAWSSAVRFTQLLGDHARKLAAKGSSRQYYSDLSYMFETPKDMQIHDELAGIDLTPTRFSWFWLVLSSLCFCCGIRWSLTCCRRRLQQGECLTSYSSLIPELDQESTDPDLLDSASLSPSHRQLDSHRHFRKSDVQICFGDCVDTCDVDHRAIQALKLPSRQDIHDIVEERVYSVGSGPRAY